MKNLFSFLWKNNFILLFILLELISYLLFVTANNFQRTQFWGFSNSISGNLYQFVSRTEDYFTLGETNQNLIKENARLRTYLAAKELDQALNDTISAKYIFKGAKVVNNSTNRRNNFLTIDKGSEDGIEPDMGVITNSGVVGVVVGVSKHFSAIMSLLHKDAKISAKIKKDGTFGPLSWPGEDYHYGLLTDIPNHVHLTKGDTIVTSAYGALFPENIPLGTVESFEIKSGESFYTIKVKLSTEFKKLRYVYLVRNKLKSEQDELEKTNSKERKE